MAQDEMKGGYALGLDLGVGSVGWAVVALDHEGHARNVVKAGAHLFEAGTQGNIEEGRDESRARPRRDARHMRRQTWRRARRKRHLIHELQRAGLLPAGSTNTPAEIDEFVKSLDAALQKRWEDGADHRQRQVLPYRLRADAIRRRLQPEEVGRAFYHLAQRRGFLSMRKSESKQDDEEGAVKQGIAELDQRMREADAETLGEYFASLDPTDPEAKRIRGRWTSRQMYEHEFNKIWSEQAVHHPSMTDQAREAVRRAIFHYRPLKSQRHLIGKCNITGKRRAPAACRLAQRFRMLQKVNDLRIVPHDRIEQTDPSSGKTKRRWVKIPRAEGRPLDADERARVFARLKQGDATFSDLRKPDVLNLKPNMRFNFETEGEKKLPGNRTAEVMRRVFGERWDALSDEDQEQAVDDLLGYTRKDALVRRARNRWGLVPEAAEAFAEAPLEEGYAAHSRQALRDLINIMQDGTPYATAYKQLCPEAFEAAEPVDELPPVYDAVSNLTNPTVARALTELRKVVNAIIRRHGKPERIHIELARDLKLGRKRREEVSRNIQKRREERERAKERILDEIPGLRPSRTDIDKVLLADECGWRCPFTGTGFGMRELLGPTPQVDIEHIWPFSRSLDNSFDNRTLCLISENRERKRNYTPREAYSDDPERYEEILQRVRAFRSDRARVKLGRFEAETIPEGFSERHLVESRYISKAAGEYLAVLYGGRWDAGGSQRIRVNTGQMTAWLRREWSLDAVLSEEDEKNRADHRHHAIDAIVVAASTPRMVQMLQRAAERASDVDSRRLFASVDAPWSDFLDDVRRAVDDIVVSHRQDKRVRGPLHAESLYSRPFRGKNNGRHRIRKQLHKLTPDDVKKERIVDPRVREAVRAQLEALGEKNPAKAFAEPANHPRLVSRDGRAIPVHKVRIEISAKPHAIAAEARRRYVASTKGSNHHTVIMAKLDKEGNEKTWVDEPVTLTEVHDRKRRRAEGEDVSVFSRDVPDGFRFKFTLGANEYVEMDSVDQGPRAIYRVQKISRGDIEFRRQNDGRTQQEVSEAGERERLRGSTLFARNARKVHVNHLGEVKRAGG